MSLAVARAVLTMFWATDSTKAFSSFSPVPRLLKLGTWARAAGARTATASRPASSFLMLPTPLQVVGTRAPAGGGTTPAAVLPARPGGYFRLNFLIRASTRLRLYGTLLLSL